MSKENFTQNSVAELRQMLVNSGKYTTEQADEIKGKTKLVEAVLELGNIEDLQATFEEAEIEPPVIQANSDESELDLQQFEIAHETPPDYNASTWHDYVMSKFTEAELVDNTYPKVLGLRRVAEELLGDIVESGPSSIFPATSIDHPGRASVIYTIVFDWMNTGFKREYKACADAWEGNTDDGYGNYPLCIAETRAEARALRRALKLQIAAAEEITMKDIQKGVKEETSAGEWQENDKISEAQIIFLKKKCADLEVDVNAYINSGKVKYTDIKDISRATALKMIERLNQYQTSTNSSVDIPIELKVSDK